METDGSGHAGSDAAKDDKADVGKSPSGPFGRSISQPVPDGTLLPKGSKGIMDASTPIRGSVGNLARIRQGEPGMTRLSSLLSMDARMTARKGSTDSMSSMGARRSSVRGSIFKAEESLGSQLMSRNSSALQNVAAGTRSGSTGSIQSDGARRNQTMRAVEKVASFVPKFVVDFVVDQLEKEYHEAVAKGKNPREPGTPRKGDSKTARQDSLLPVPFSDTQFSVCMLADISGFSKCADKLSRQGRKGMDILSQVLNTVFQPMIDCIFEHGGDVVKFCGDALLVVWREGQAGDNTSRQFMCRSSGRCGTALLKTFTRMQDKASKKLEQATGRSSGKFMIGKNTPEKSVASVAAAAAEVIVGLSLHVGAAAGATRYSVVGSHATRIEALVGGKPLEVMGLAEGAATAGQFVAHEGLYESAGVQPQKSQEVGSLLYLVSESEFADAEAMKETKVVDEVAVGEDETVQSDDEGSTTSSGDDNLTESPHKRIHAHEEMAGIAGILDLSRAIAGLLAAPARRQCHSSETPAELRSITALFCVFDEEPKEPQKVIEAALPAIMANDAMLRQFVVDDKGCVLIACLGVPSHFHADDPVRGVALACAIQKAMKDLGLLVSVGVTTGESFCGCVGSEARREYAVVGDVVNLAARLANVKQHRGRVLCDHPTYRMAETSFVFDDLDSVTVKGKQLPIRIFSPTGRIGTENNKTIFVGRNHEINLLRQVLRADCDDLRLLLIIGKAGIGKTAMLNEAIRRQSQQGKHSPLERMIRVRVQEKEAGRGDFQLIQSIFPEFWGVSAVDQEGIRDIILELVGTTARAVGAPLPRVFRLTAELLELSWDMSPEDYAEASARGGMQPASPPAEGVTNIDITYSLIDGLFAMLDAQDIEDITAVSEDDLGDLTAGNSKKEPPLLILDNAENLDDWSWCLLPVLMGCIPTQKLIVLTRPFEKYDESKVEGAYNTIEQSPLGFEDLFDLCEDNDEEGAAVELAGLSMDETRRLIFEHSEKGHTPNDKDITQIYRYGKGVPLWTVEMTRGMMIEPMDGQNTTPIASGKRGRKQSVEVKSGNSMSFTRRGRKQSMDGKSGGRSGSEKRNRKNRRGSKQDGERPGQSVLRSGKNSLLSGHGREEIPEAIVRSIFNRYDILEEVHQLVLRILSVARGMCSAGDIINIRSLKEDVDGKEEVDIDFTDENVHSVLTELQRYEWLVKANGAVARYRFAHSLFADVIRASQPEQYREELHLRIATHLITVAESGTVAARAKDVVFEEIFERKFPPMNVCGAVARSAFVAGPTETSRNCCLSLCLPVASNISSVIFSLLKQICGKRTMHQEYAGMLCRISMLPPNRRTS